MYFGVGVCLSNAYKSRGQESSAGGSDCDHSCENISRQRNIRASREDEFSVSFLSSILIPIGNNEALERA